MSRPGTKQSKLKLADNDYVWAALTLLELNPAMNDDEVVEAIAVIYRTSVEKVRREIDEVRDRLKPT